MRRNGCGALTGCGGEKELAKNHSRADDVLSRLSESICQRVQLQRSSYSHKPHPDQNIGEPGGLHSLACRISCRRAERDAPSTPEKGWGGEFGLLLTGTQNSG